MNKNQINTHRPRISKIYNPFEKDNANNPFSFQLTPWANNTKYFQSHPISKNDMLESLSLFNTHYQTKIIPQLNPSRNSVNLTAVHSKVSRYLQSEQHPNRNSLPTSKRNRKNNKNYDTVEQNNINLKQAKLKNISLQWDDDLIYSPQKKYKEQILQNRVSTALAKHAEQIVGNHASQGYQPSVYQLRRNKIPKILSRQKKGNFYKQKDQIIQEDEFSDRQIMTHRSVFSRKISNFNKQNKPQVLILDKITSRKLQIEEVDEGSLEGNLNLVDNNQQTFQKKGNAIQVSPKHVVNTIQIDFQKLQKKAYNQQNTVQKYQPYKVSRKKNGYRIYNKGRTVSKDKKDKQSWMG